MRRMTETEIMHWMVAQGAGNFDEVRARVFGGAGSLTGGVEIVAAVLEKLGTYAISSGITKHMTDGSAVEFFTVCDKDDPVLADAVACVDEMGRLVMDIEDGRDALDIACDLDALRTAVLSTGDGADMREVFKVLRCMCAGELD